MSTIYVVVCDTFDGECSDWDMIKAFTRKTKAEVFMQKCHEELERIREELQVHNAKYVKELSEISERLRIRVLENSKNRIVMDYSKDPDSIRRREIQEIEQNISRSHKYHNNHYRIDLYEEVEYNIRELQLE